MAMPSIDFSILGDLGKTYKTARREAARERTLADLGQSGDWSRGAEALAAEGDLEGAMSLAKIAESRGGKQTDEIREYNFDTQQLKAAGRPVPTFGDWKAGLKRAGATNVNTTVNSGEREYDKVLNKAEAERFIGFQKGGADAQKQITTLDSMEKLTQDPNFYSGVGAERFGIPLKQAIATFGGDPNAAASMETFRSLSNRSVLDAAGGSLGTAISNADRDFIVNTAPNLSNTPEGNRQLIQMNKKVAGRQQEVAKLARDYAKKNNGRIDAGFDEQLAIFAEKNPLFPRAPAQASPAQPAPAKPQGGAPVPVKSKQERDALPPGTQYVAPDGSVRTRQ